MSELSKNNVPLLICLICAIGWMGCKKDADIPAQARVSDFSVTCDVTDTSGNTFPFHYRGDDQIFYDTFAGIPNYLTVGYSSYYYINGTNKYITGNLHAGYFFQIFRLDVCRNVSVSEAIEVPEWTREELESVLLEGKNYMFGDGPGQIRLIIKEPISNVYYQTDDRSNADDYLVLESVEEYGSPEVGIPYFGKIARFTFQCNVYDGDKRWRLTNGEAVLFFRYFNF